MMPCHVARITTQLGTGKINWVLSDLETIQRLPSPTKSTSIDRSAS